MPAICAPRTAFDFASKRDIATSWKTRFCIILRDGSFARPFLYDTDFNIVISNVKSDEENITARRTTLLILIFLLVY